MPRPRLRPRFLLLVPQDSPFRRHRQTGPRGFRAALRRAGLRRRGLRVRPRREGPVTAEIGPPPPVPLRTLPEGRLGCHRERDLRASPPPQSRQGCLRGGGLPALPPIRLFPAQFRNRSLLFSSCRLVAIQTEGFVEQM